MKLYENYNVCGKLRRALQIATSISQTHGAPHIRTSDVLLGIFCEDSGLYFCCEEEGIIISSEEILECLENNEEEYKKIWGEEATNYWFASSNIAIKQITNEQGEDDDCQKQSKSEVESMPTISIPVPRLINFNGVLVPGFSNVDFVRMGEDNEGEYNELDYMTSAMLYSSDLENAFEVAANRCKVANQDYIDIDNLTYALLEQENTSAIRLMEYIIDEFGFLSLEDIIEKFKESNNIFTNSSNTTTFTLPMPLQGCCDIFNEKFDATAKTDILKRDTEISSIWNILSKKTKKNAVLIGDPGVGKTAIVEAITQAIVNQTCPKRFYDYKVISFDVNAALSGTIYRGQFEEKVEHLKKFIEDTPNVILFIDELHQVLGAGSTIDSGVDLSGALKPILSRDSVRVIGATTIDEYERILSRDGAFKRRFEVVLVKEPKCSEVKKMIASRVKTLEEYHHVRLEEGLIDHIIIAAQCFYRTGHNPDISIDLCDRCMSLAECDEDEIVTKKHIERIFEENFKKFEEFTKEDKRAIAYHEAGHYIVSRLTSVDKTIIPLVVSIIPSEDFLGVNITEEKENHITDDYEYLCDRIKVSLAGRIAEELVSKSFNTGASSDLKKANEIARNMVLSYGMYSSDPNYLKPALPNSKGALAYKFIFEDGLQCSEQKADEIRQKIEETLKKEYENAFSIIERNKHCLESIANLLLEKKIVTGQELDKVFQETVSKN